MQATLADAPRARRGRPRSGASCGSLGDRALMKYVSTRGTAPRPRLRRRPARRPGRRRRALRARALAGALAEAVRSEVGPTPTSPSRSCGRSSRASIDRDAFAAIVAEALRHLRAPRRRARSSTLGDDRAAARAVPRPDAGVQGRRPAARRSAVRPRADTPGRAGHDRRRDLGRHRLGGHRGLRDRDAIDIVILHPGGRVSDVQRRQMTTVVAPNVHNVAVEGTFDDCQDLVKAMFADAAFRDEVRLSAVNSINWARVMAQIVYYVTAVARLGGRLLASACPPATSATSSPAGSPSGWACRSTSSSSAPTATTSSPASSPTGAMDDAARSCPRSARRWTSRCRPTSSACCSSCSGATAPRSAELMGRFRATGRRSTSALDDAAAVPRRAGVDDEATRP